MAECDIQELITDGACFTTVNPRMLNAAIAQLWCNAADVISGGGTAVSSITWQSTDSNWYVTTFIDLDGVIVPHTDQTPVAPGTDPYIVFELDGTNYRVHPSTIDGITDLIVGDSTVEAGIPFKLVRDNNLVQRTMRLVDMGGPVINVS